MGTSKRRIQCGVLCIALLAVAVAPGATQPLEWHALKAAPDAAGTSASSAACDPRARPAAPTDIDLSSGLGLDGGGSGKAVYVQWRRPQGDNACVSSYSIRVTDAASGARLASFSVPAPAAGAHAGSAPLAPTAAMLRAGAAIKVTVAAASSGGGEGPAGWSAPHRLVPVSRPLVSLSDGGSGSSSGSGSKAKEEFAFVQPCRDTTPGAPPRLEISQAPKQQGMGSTPAFEITLYHPDSSGSGSGSSSSVTGCVTGYEVTVSDGGAVLDKISIPASNPLALRTVFSYPAGAGRAAQRLAAGAVVSLSAAALNGGRRGAPLQLSGWRMGPAPGGGLEACLDVAPAAPAAVRARVFGIIGAPAGGAGAFTPPEAAAATGGSRLRGFPIVPAPPAAAVVATWRRPDGFGCVSSYSVDLLDGPGGAPVGGCKAIEVPGDASVLEARFDCAAALAAADDGGDGDGGGRAFVVSVAAKNGGRGAGPAAASSTLRVASRPVPGGGGLREVFDPSAPPAGGFDVMPGGPQYGAGAPPRQEAGPRQRTKASGGVRRALR